jgi:hypothetical protein
MNNSGEEMIKVETGDIFLTKSKYCNTENLAKEWGMTNMGQYCKYTMQAIQESHYPDQE